MGMVRGAVVVSSVVYESSSFERIEFDWVVGNVSDGVALGCVFRVEVGLPFAFTPDALRS